MKKIIALLLALTLVLSVGCAAKSKITGYTPTYGEAFMFNNGTQYKAEFKDAISPETLERTTGVFSTFVSFYSTVDTTNLEVPEYYASLLDYVYQGYITDVQSLVAPLMEMDEEKLTEKQQMFLDLYNDTMELYSSMYLINLTAYQEAVAEDETDETEEEPSAQTVEPEQEEEVMMTLEAEAWEELFTQVVEYGNKYYDSPFDVVPVEENSDEKTEE